MATERLKIILDAAWQGSSQVKAAAKDITGVEQASKKGGIAIASLAKGIGAATVAFGTVAVAARAAWSTMKQGAELDTINRKFERLAGSIGTTGEALKQDLNNNIGLLMSNSQQLGLATDLMSLGLAKTHEEAIKLSSVAGQLGMDMNQLVLTLTNQTTMRFDSLGVAVDGFEDKVKSLEKAGYSADEAFKWAFIQQAEEQIERVGSKAGTVEGQIVSLENAWTNAKEAFQAEFAANMVGQMDTAGVKADELSEKLMRLSNMWATFTGFVVGSILSGPTDPSVYGYQYLPPGAGRRDYVSATSQYNPLAPPTATPLGPAAPRGYNFTTSVAHRNAIEQARMQRENNALLADTRNRAAATQTALDGLASAEAEVAANWDGVNRATAEAVEEFGAVGGAIGSVVSEMELLNAATGDYFNQARKTKEFNPFEAAMDAAKGANALQLARFGVAGGLFSEAEATQYINRAALMHQAEMVGQLMGEGMAGEEAAAILAGVQQGIDDGTILADQFFADIENTKPVSTLELNIDAAWAQYMTLIGMIESTPPSLPGPSSGGSSGGGASGGRRSGTDSGGESTSAGVVVNAYTKEAAAVAMAGAERITRARIGL